VKARVRVFREKANGEERKREEEREVEKKNEGNRVIKLLYEALDRVGSDPIQRPIFSTFRSRSYWIRINPTPLMRSGDPDPSTSVDLGRVTVVFQPIFSFLSFLAMFTPILTIWTPCALYLFYKNSEKLLRVLGMFVTTFVIFLHVEN